MSLHQCANSAYKLLTTHLVDGQYGVGAAVGVLEDGSSEIICLGSTRKISGLPINEQTLFEIGSVTKVFTCLLLQLLVTAGKLRLDVPIAHYLPQTCRIPEKRGRAITLLDVATHTSGLPRLPANLKPADKANPYNEYTESDLWKFLSGYALPRDVASTFEYSNLGGGLLGVVISHAMKQSLADLIRIWITEPLEMSSTSFHLQAEQIERFAAPHSKDGVQVPRWTFSSLAGAGGMLSTAQDLLRFVAAQLKPVTDEVSQAMSETRQVRRSTGIVSLDVVGLVCHVRSQ